MLSFDTNILIYAADRDAGVKHEAALSLMDAATSAEVVLSHQSLIEFLNVTTRKLNLPLEDVAKIVRAWLRTFDSMAVPATVVEDTVSLLQSHRLSTWDAQMLAVCAANGCKALLSEDMADGAVYGGVKVLNPFNPRNGAAIAELLQS
jgi:predicted nucleic acid-binding protein